MKMMLKRFFCCLLMVMMAPGLVFAAAENEGMGTDRVGLICEGELPPAGLGSYPRADLSEFNALILKELKALSSLIDVSAYQLTLSEFRNAYRGLLNANPDMFYVSGGFSYYYSGGIVTEVIPEYKYTAEEIPGKVAAFNRELNRIISYADQASSMVGKLLLVNDYLCTHYEYDESASAISSPEEMFEKGRGVCQAYTLIYVAVCNRLGIANTTATSTPMNHIWNLVNLDGSWYHVDVTWNDPVPNAPYRARHEYFLRSDAGIREAEHYGWVASVKATNPKYDRYFWQDIEHAVPVQKDLAYFTPNNDGFPDGRICTGSIANGRVEEILRYEVYIASRYYPNINPVWATSDTIYFGMADSVYAIPMSGGTPVQVFSLNDPSEYLFYFYLSGSTMYVTSTNMDTRARSVHSFSLGSAARVTLDTAWLEMKLGDGERLTYTVEPAPEGAAVWTSGDESVARVDSDGVVTAVGAGVTTVTLQIGTAVAKCTVVVHSNRAISLPLAVTEIDADTFANTAAVEVELHEGVQTIGEQAFCGCSELRIVNVPESVKHIASSAFEDCGKLTLLCVAGSQGEAFAVEHGLPYVLKP